MYTQTTDSILHLVGSISADVFVLLAFVLLLIALGLAKGKDMLIVFILAVYPSALFTAHFPFYEKVQHISLLSTPSIPELVVFVATLLVGMRILSSYIDTGYQQHTFWRYVELITLSLAGVVLTVSVLYNIIEFQYLYNLSPVIDTVFASGTYFFFWLIAPFIIIPSFVRP